MRTSAIRDIAGGVEIAVKVVPGSSRDRVAGLLGEAVKIAVAAPPEKGKANQAVIDVLARALGVRRNAVQIRSGHTQPRKTLAVTGLTAAQACEALGL